jgi:hypothetical protein
MTPFANRQAADCAAQSSNPGSSETSTLPFGRTRNLQHLQRIGRRQRGSGTQEGAAVEVHGVLLGQSCRCRRVQDRSAGRNVRRLHGAETGRVNACC